MKTKVKTKVKTSDSRIQLKDLKVGTFLLYTDSDEYEIYHIIDLNTQPSSDGPKYALSCVSDSIAFSTGETIYDLFVFDDSDEYDDRPNIENFILIEKICIKAKTSK